MTHYIYITDIYKICYLGIVSWKRYIGKGPRASLPSPGLHSPQITTCSTQKHSELPPLD